MDTHSLINGSKFRLIQIKCIPVLFLKGRSCDPDMCECVNMHIKVKGLGKVTNAK